MNNVTTKKCPSCDTVKHLGEFGPEGDDDTCGKCIRKAFRCRYGSEIHHRQKQEKREALIESMYTDILGITRYNEWCLVVGEKSFYKWLSSSEFYKLFEAWYDSDFISYLKPCIVLIDKDGCFEKGNFELTTWKDYHGNENPLKVSTQILEDRVLKSTNRKTGEVTTYKNMSDAVDFVQDINLLDYTWDICYPDGSTFLGKINTPVLRCDISGLVIEEYKDVKTSAGDTGIFIKEIIEVLDSKRLMCHGYIFKYKEADKSR